MARRSPTRISASEMAGTSSSGNPEEDFPSRLKWPQFRSAYLQARPGSSSEKISAAWINYHSLEYGRSLRAPLRTPERSPPRNSSPPPVRQKSPPQSRLPPPGEWPISISFPLFVQRKTKRTVAEKIEAQQGESIVERLPTELQLEVTKRLPRDAMRAFTVTSRAGQVATSDRLKVLCRTAFTGGEVLAVLESMERPIFGIAKGEGTDDTSFIYIYQTDDEAEPGCIAVTIGLEQGEGDQVVPGTTMEDMTRGAASLVRMKWLTRLGLMDPALVAQLLLRRASCERNEPGLLRDLFIRLYDRDFNDIVITSLWTYTEEEEDDYPGEYPGIGGVWTFTGDNYHDDRTDHNVAAMFTVWVQACVYHWEPIRLGQELTILSIPPRDDGFDGGDLPKANLILTRLRAAREHLLSLFH